MGLLDKLKDMFTEEVEVEEEPIKKETIQVEITAPEIKKEDINEPLEKEEPIKKPEKIERNVPIFFDDSDFKTLEKPKQNIQPKPVVEKYKPKKVEAVDKKLFKPTPIISPVYGVLDKNYHKEDIKSKNNLETSTYYNHKEVSIDDVRKKAYGTLSDELEVSLFSETTLEMPDNDITNLDNNEIDMFDDLMDLKDNDDKFSKTEELRLGDEKAKDETDLFDLIDSMYTKGDE